MFNKNIYPWIYGVLFLTGSLFLFLGGPDYHSYRSFKHLWNVGHIVYFALFTGLLAQLHFIAKMSLKEQWITILLISLLVGLTIEFMQYGTTRTPDFGDVLRDLIGSLLVLVFGSLGSALKPASVRVLLQSTVLVLVLIQLWPLAKSLIDEEIARRQFPLLNDFETPFEIDRWFSSAGISVETIPSISHSKLLKVSLTTYRYSGVALVYFDGNWTLFRSLKISLYNPDVKLLSITLRIHDLQHADGYQEYEDRFNRKFVLTQGWNHIEIDLKEVELSPAQRSVDMKRIRGLGLFAVSLPEARVVYIDNIHLSH